MRIRVYRAVMSLICHYCALYNGCIVADVGSITPIAVKVADNTVAADCRAISLAIAAMSTYIACYVAALC